MSSEKLHHVAFTIVYAGGPVAGRIDVTHGDLVELDCRDGEAAAPTFSCRGTDPCRVAGTVANARLAPGGSPTLVSVATETNPFTFLLRDVTVNHPIVIPAYGVAVTTAGDGRTYEELLAAAHGTARGASEAEVEPSFAEAAAWTRDQVCETWLGLSRDMRIFRVGYGPHAGYFGWIQARYAAQNVPVPGYEDGVVLEMMLGRGAGAQVDLHRHLDRDRLPILHTTQHDGDITYHVITFATPERSPLTQETLRGTDFLVADAHAWGHMQTEAQAQRAAALALRETATREEAVVALMRVTATNTVAVPRYAFLTGLVPRDAEWHLDGATGFGHLDAADRDGDPIYAVMQLTHGPRLHGERHPLPDPELAVLLQPGESVVLEVAVPHHPFDGPLAPGRAQALAAWDFDEKLGECRAFWEAKLASAARIAVPEPRIDAMIQAGLLHLDMITYGLEPDAPVAATIGLYCPIGSESAPIIQFYDSVGRHKLAERALDYFVEKQHADGFMQNFGGYMLETGAVLWTMGQHWRTTRDVAWAQRVAANVTRACVYLADWRARNQDPALQGTGADAHGYGMIEGKVADPPDPFRHFMLNGYAYLGLQRAGEMLAESGAIAAEEAARWLDEAAAWREDIRTALAEAMAASAVVPLDDGTWAPTAPPWPEARGPAALHLDGTPSNSHHTVAARDSILGPLYLVLQEVLEPDEVLTGFLLASHRALFTHRNVAFSQPYYSRHPYVHLRRGEVHDFLRAYYGTVAGLADRETYTFWEHYYGASPHKTHEEAWFLMQTRWMLWLEEGETLQLLAGIPRAWLADGREIHLNHVASTLGTFSLHVTSTAAGDHIAAELTWHRGRGPAGVRVRLPHPQRRPATACQGGTYDPATETVAFPYLAKTVRVVVDFDAQRSEVGSATVRPRNSN